MSLGLSIESGDLEEPGLKWAIQSESSCWDLVCFTGWVQLPVFRLTFLPLWACDSACDFMGEGVGLDTARFSPTVISSAHNPATLLEVQGIHGLFQTSLTFELKPVSSNLSYL